MAVGWNLRVGFDLCGRRMTLALTYSGEGPVLYVRRHHETRRHCFATQLIMTGDQLPIGREIAGLLGLGTHLLDASGFGDTPHHETAQLADAIEQAELAEMQTFSTGGDGTGNRPASS